MHTLSLYGTYPDGRAENHVLRFPGGWDEVVPKQLPVIAMARLSDQDHGAVRFALLRELANVPAYLMEASGMSAAACAFQHPETAEWQLLPQLDWVFSPATFEKSLLPFIDHGGLRWKGPDDAFETMSLDQWLYATSLLNNYHMATDVDTKDRMLDCFLGAAYQPAAHFEPSADGTAPKGWSNLPIEAYADQLKSLPLGTKLAAVLNYEAAHAQVRNMYPRVFDPSGEAATSPLGLFSIAHDVAKSAVFGHIGMVRTARMHDVLGYMEHALFQDAENERRAKQTAK
jgi:hypothetical protein